MVLYKRKPIQMLPPPAVVNENTEVFVMPGTDEVFTDYEKYLKRYDYLMQKKFVDAVNGKSNLNFFDALASESKSSEAIENVFPAVLKDPILRKVQFSTVSRIDELVNNVYDDFKKEFFPGEEVVVTVDEEHIEGVVREKAKFPMIRGPDGAVQRPAFARYFVRIPGSPREAIVDDRNVRRDRKIFTKQHLRSFLKHSLQREAWIGAPWLVKEHLAIEYRLPMEIPSHLLQDAKILANKQMQQLQMKPPKGRRSNVKAEAMIQQQQLMQMQALQQQHPGASPAQIMQIQQSMQQPTMVKPPPPPPIKYPIEDLDLPLKRDGHRRPELNFFTEEQKQYVLSKRLTSFNGISMESMGLFLEVWNTLNVQCEVYVLDSFTFDDFVDAMQYDQIEPSCQLLEEVHCAVLSQLVDKNSKVQVTKGLLDQVVEVEEAPSETNDDSEYTTPQPDVPARSTRSRLSHVDPNVENGRTPTTDKPHRAAEMLGDRSWKTRLAAREYEDGGWQVILVGLLHQLSLHPAFSARCNKVLAELAPMDAEPTAKTAEIQYCEMNVNLRILALELIVMLSIGTKAIKEFLEHCSDDMTEVRKRKQAHQREKREAMELLQVKDRDRKILLPENMPGSPPPESVEGPTANGEGDETLETNGTSSPDPDDEAPPGGRSLRRQSDRKRKREEDDARRERERIAKAEAAAAKQQSKQSKEFKKLVQECEKLREQILDAEAKIQECDADLREANVQRTKVLGKDRFCNRYYWFERNGQPFGGLPNSSTSHYGYANGRIWVQGPDKMEVEGFIERTPEERSEYKARFGATPLERRKLEEGDSFLKDATEWGYIDDSVKLNNLIVWLDEKGEREKKLRKELIDWREVIAQYMQAYKDFMESESQKRAESGHESETRVHTRHKTQEDVEAAQERCLKWRNTMAEEDLGHPHSRPGKKPAPKKQAPRQQKGVASMVSRHTGKPMTRQGGSYSFK
ncbi:hypothetical protein EJ03DRAFT_295241 [Teratosphaeria nubilosa]|uniref:WAC domain-containing protein n=1 Tax=Teratosphaeria nubilosa TaxID=161662 RepID=A0A6G1L5D4_9PEZI|nr:hypothetical protein EJ03DRAFT_295241 [Teratosphaeria nubilosa]